MEVSRKKQVKIRTILPIIIYTSKKIKAKVHNSEEETTIDNAHWTYITILEQIYFYTTLFCCTNFRIAKSHGDHVRGGERAKYYVVKNYGLQRMLCAILQLMLLPKAVKDLWLTFEALQNASGDIVAYFGFINTVLLYLVAFSHVSYSWLSRKNLEHCIQKMQSSRFSLNTPTTWRRRLWYARIFIILYAISAFSWSFGSFGLAAFDFSAIPEASVQIAELKYPDVFALVNGSGLEISQLILQVYVIIVEFYFYFMLHMSDIHCLLMAALTYLLIKDYSKQILTDERIPFMSAKELWTCYNYLKDTQNLYGNYVLRYNMLLFPSILTFLPFHAIELLNPGYVSSYGRFLLSCYLAEVFFIFKFSANANMTMRKTVKRMFRKGIPSEFSNLQFRSILIDMRNGEFGVKIGIFTSYTSGIIGKCLQSLFTFAMINLTNTQKLG